MKNIFRLSGGFFLAAALISLLAGCDTANSPGGNVTPPIEQGPTFDVNKNSIDFGTLNGDLTQTEISDYISTAVSHLSTQAVNLREDYKAILEGNGSGKALDFAEGATIMENNLVTDYQNGEDGDTIFDSFADLVNSVNLTIGESRNVFRAKVMAFRYANQLQQRQFGDTSDLESDLKDACQRIGSTAPQGDFTPEMVTSLRTILQAAIPTFCGDATLRGKLIQQLEDTAQFEGWIEDIEELGFTASKSGQRSMGYDAGSNTITMGK